MMNMNCIPFPFAFVLLTVITSQFSETLFPGEQPVKKQDNFKIKLLRFLSISSLYNCFIEIISGSFSSR